MIKLTKVYGNKTHTTIYKDGTKKVEIVGRFVSGYKYNNFFIDKGAVGWNVYENGEYSFSCVSLEEVRCSL